MKGRININNYEAFLLDYMEGRLDASEKEALLSFFIAHPELGDFNQLTGDDLPSLDAEPATGNWNKLKKEFTASEEQILNFLEGDLNAQQKTAFEEELKKNNLLAAETEAFRKTYLKAEPETVFDDKTLLHKTEDDVLLLNPALRYTEGEMTEEEKLAFEKEISDNTSLKKEITVYALAKLVADHSVIYPNKQELKKQAKVFILFSYRNMVAVAAALLLLIGLFVLTVPAVDGPQPLHSVSENAKGGEVSTKQGAGNTHVAAVPVHETKKLAEGTMPAKQLAVPAKKQGRRSNQGPALKTLPEQTKAVSEKQMATQQQKESPFKVQQNTSTDPDTNVLAVSKQGLNVLKDPVLPKTETTTPNTFNDNRVGAAAAEPVRAIVSLQEYDDDDEAEDDQKKSAKPGFWKRAVKIAQNANGMGLKSVYGESGKKSALLTFNDISVEKK